MLQQYSFNLLKLECLECSLFLFLFNEILLDTRQKYLDSVLKFLNSLLVFLCSPDKNLNSLAFSKVIVQLLPFSTASSCDCPHFDYTSSSGPSPSLTFFFSQGLSVCCVFCYPLSHSSYLSYLPALPIQPHTTCCQSTLYCSLLDLNTFIVIELLVGWLI